MFYEGFREALEYSHEKKFLTEINITARKFSSLEELVMGGIAGGMHNQRHFLCSMLE